MQNQKHLFSLPEHIKYLNGAYMSPQLKSVEAAGIKALKQKNEPYTISTEDFFIHRSNLQKLFAELIHTEDPEKIAIIPSASYGLANVAQNVQLEPGDEILLVDEQFPSNYYTWKKAADKAGAIIQIIKPPKDFMQRGAIWNQAILEAINHKTKVVAMAQVHWADGTLFQLMDIREATKNNGAYLVIDGTQSVGAMPFSIQTIQPDALICAGYKWLLGPYSLGLAYYGEALLKGEPIEDNWINRRYSEDFTGLTSYEDAYQPKAARFSVGESSNFNLVPMLIKAIEQLLVWQPSNIQEYCKSISEGPIQEIRAKGYDIETDSFKAHHLFGIYLPKAKDMDVIKNTLKANHIMVSYRGSAIRVSPNVYNSQSDLEALSACL